MNTAEKYIYTVYGTKNFSKAAEKLFVSQPALSRTIKNHEEKIGYEIFNRKTSPLTLTQKGVVYIEYLKEIMEIEQRLNHQISAINNSMTKKISIGGFNSTSHIVLPVLCKEFSCRFPDVSIKIDCGEKLPLSSLFLYLEKGTLDILITSSSNSMKFKSEVLWREKYMLLIRKDYPGIKKLSKYSLDFNEVLTGIYPDQKEITDGSLLKNIKIFLPGKNRDIYKKFSDFLKRRLDESIDILHFNRMDLQYKFMLNGIGGIVIPQSVIIDKGYNTDDFYCFSLAVPDNTREALLLYKENENTSPYVKEFLSLAKEIYGGSIVPKI